MLLTSVTPTLTAGPALADETPALALTESEQALKEAADSGTRVEVVGERTERDTVFANPDGATFTLESSIVPVRVNADNGWVTPDATLERREDGSIGPKASVVDVAFSAGGAGQDLVTVGQDGQMVSMGWPGSLPAPRLDGPRAVYENVLPDVNLILTATVEGFQQVLEVETPAAAALPELKEIEYALSADGLSLREGRFGSMEALDGNGQVVFRSPTARMWNSAGDDIASAASPTAGLQPQSVGMLALAPASATEDPRGEADELVAPPGEGDPLGGPGTGDESAVMEVQLGQDSLTVTPDPGLIAATEAEDFPLYIDPSVEVDQTKRTVLSSDGDVFYDFANGENGMSVGKCGSAVINGVSYYCGSGYVNRMYFEFSPSALRGKHVLDATFRVTETWSFSCDSRWVDLKRTDWISSASKWPGPTPRDHMGDRDVSAGRGDLCSPAQPRKPIEFHDNPEETDENLAPTVRALADGTYNSLTLMLRAKDETDTISWKRFNNDGTLVATYMSKPAVPGEYGVLSGGTVPVCNKTEQGATMISDPTPSLLATPRAASGAEAQAMLRVYYDLDYKSDGTWYDAPPPTTGSVAPTAGHASYVSSAKDFPTQTKNWNSPLKENTLYRYTAYTHSFKDTSYTSWLSSSGTPWCYFRVDTTAPEPPVVKFNSVYKECLTGGACEVWGGPGKAGSFTFTYGEGDSGSTNTHYMYRLSSSVVWSGWKAATNGSYTTNIAPPTSGSFVLNVMSQDSLGRTGYTAVKFLVQEGAGPVGRWDFHEPSGAALDTSTSDPALKNNLTLTASGATRNDHGRRGVVTAADKTKSQDKALALTRSSHGAASSAKRVVDTLGSFTVTAWARLDSNSSVATVLSQDGTINGSFYLGYCTDLDDQGKANTWCIRLADSDKAGSYFSQRVNADNPPQFNTWTHLGVTVDTTEMTLRFYVNGVLQGTDDLTVNRWASNGGFQVGRAKYSSGYSEYFSGEIDEVAVWQWELTPENMKKEAGRLDSSNWAYTELVAQYQPDGGSGTSLTDNSGYGNTLTMSSASSLNGTSIVLDGVDDSGSTSRPLVDDTGSFTVSTTVKVDRVKVDSMPDNTTHLQVLGQQTANGSSWGIWFQKTGKILEAVDDPEDDLPPVDVMVPAGVWHFGRLNADGTVDVSVRSEKAIALGDEVSLVGSFDAITRNIRLFQGGDSKAQGDELAYQTELGSGFTVGKAWNGAAWGRFLPGEIRDIRVWAGAMTTEAQVETVVG
ncbi:LamG domain-containing protein [Streptomyces sp. NBC_00250]|uniref:LamG domain-containing protein n=1 Tax=Streptomyces sp. NBC_00250 TaxID=2903641 RepID=UPI002E2AAC29|nr:LamG domain-containing protein [Streptomyces sp. NBC_00250]